MEEFLRANYYYLTHGVEILAAVTGLLFYKKFKNTNIKYFIFFIVSIALAELLALYTFYIPNDGAFSFLKGTVFQTNIWWYTIFWKIAAIVFYIFYFIKIIKTKRFLRLLKYLLYVFPSFSVLYIIFNWNDFFIRPFPVINIFGAIIIFMCAIFYFFEVLQSESILTFYKSYNFYIAATIFMWWLIITPLVFYDIYFRYVDWSFIFLQWEIYLFANILMYLTFTFALIWCKPENK